MKQNNSKKETRAKEFFPASSAVWGYIVSAAKMLKNKMIKDTTGSIRIMAIIALHAWMIFATGCTASRTGKPSLHKPVEGEHWRLPLGEKAVLTMVWIDPGTFTMGSPVTEPGRKPDEGPQHKVSLTKGYWLGKTEVTIGQWRAVMNESLKEHVVKMLDDETVYDFGGQREKLREFMHFNQDDPDRIMANEGDSLPMYFVSWEDAMEFCRKLTIQEKTHKRIPVGYAFTLPTEAQWEYACRAGTTTATFAGPISAQGQSISVLDSIAWYDANNSVNYQGKALGHSGAGPRNAGEKKPNAWGLQDMPGNLWEWCSDWYGVYTGHSVVDPAGPATGNGKVNRGGSWGSAGPAERSASRASNPPPEKSAYRGFRIALCMIR